VFVSSVIQRGIPYQIINEIFLAGKAELCISNDVIEEYYDVLHRNKFSKYPDFLFKAEQLLADIETKSRKFQVKSRVQLIGDLDDNKFLDLSSASKADFLITGNTNDFTMKIFRKTRIVTPREYWERHQPK
jgi:hypothetical protein